MNNTTNGFNDNTVVKTVYDPCPAGFKMPASNAFTGFTTTGVKVENNPSQLNVSGDWNMGWTFNNKINFPNATVFFPASGYRGGASGSLFNVGNNGYYWSAVPSSNLYGCYLNFSSGGVNPRNLNYRSYGFSVRPVSE